MSDPIIELIAQNILTTLAGVTVANEYNQTLLPWRSQKNDYSDTPPGDLTVLIEQDEKPQPHEAQRLGADEIDQIFYCVANVLFDDAVTDSLDTRRNRVYADMVKALMTDPTRGGYAEDSTILPQVNFKKVAEDDDTSGVALAMIIHYATIKGDPFTKF